MTTKSTFKD